MEIFELTVHELMDKLDKKELTSEEITKSYLSRIEEKEKDVQAFVTVTDKEALENAKAIDEKIRKEGKRDKLAGIPIGLKDNMCTKGVKTTCSSTI